MTHRSAPVPPCERFEIMPATLLPYLAAKGQPNHFFDHLADALKDAVGFRLFTLLVVDGTEVARIYSSDPEAYPVSGRKKMQSSPWGDHVLIGHKAWLGRTQDDIKWAFYDHDLIASLGCGCCINIPVIYDGTLLGTMNLLDQEKRYEESHVEIASQFAPLVIPAFQAFQTGASQS